MRILALTKYSRSGPSSRLRVFQYLEYLREHGSSVTVVPLFKDDYVRRLYAGERHNQTAIVGSYLKRIRTLLSLFVLCDYDLIWFEKEMLPWVPAVVEQVLSNRRIPYVVDYDDAIFHNYDVHSSPIIRRLLGQKIDRVMSGADCVVVGNEYLANRARHAGARRIEQLPTVIDLSRYPLTALPDQDRPTIGWIGTPITARKTLPLVAAALRRICESFPADFMTVGAGEIELGFPRMDVPWTENNEVHSIQKFDVGIMPLEDEPFQRGKCGYKLIQYMAAGRPVVASPVGANCQIVQHGSNGFLADSPREWEEALYELLRNRVRRKRMALEARNTVESKFCIQVTAPRLAGIFAEVVHTRQGLQQPSQVLESA